MTTTLDTRPAAAPAAAPPAGDAASAAAGPPGRRRPPAGARNWASSAIAIASAFLVWQGWRALAGRPGGAGHAITAEGLVLVGPAVVALVAAALVAERCWPAVRRPLGARGHRQDAAYLVLYVFVAVPVVTLLGAGFAVTLLRVAPWAPHHPFASWPRWATLLLALVLTDACNWAAHFFNHRLGTLWRYHAVHHSQEEMSILTAFRAHPLVHASFQVVALPIFLLGTGGDMPVAVLVGYIALSTLPHANVRWRFGPLHHVVVSPAYHRLHHDEADRRGVNLGAVLVVWDVLAGLAVFPAKDAAPVATGLRGRPFPVEQAAGAGGCVPVLVHQLADPLRRRRTAAAPIEASR